MKLEQEKVRYAPITLTLETKEEAELLWTIIRAHTDRSHAERKFCNTLSDWFSSVAKL